MGFCSSKSRSAEAAKTRGSEKTSPEQQQQQHVSTEPDVRKESGIDADECSNSRRVSALSDSSELGQQSSTSTSYFSDMQQKPSSLDNNVPNHLNSEDPKRTEDPKPSSMSLSSISSPDQQQSSLKQSPTGLGTQLLDINDLKRRRLTVSTIEQQDEHAGSHPKSQHKSQIKSQTKPQEEPQQRWKEIDELKIEDGQVPSPSSSSSADHKQVDQIPSPIPPSIRATVKHFNDPSLQLINDKTGKIKDVTIKMIVDLVSNSLSTYMVFGETSDISQRGFDNKNKKVLGTLDGKWDPTINGLGYTCKKGLKPESPNQDDYFFMRVDDWSLYGVFDGHGPCGHEVSAFVHRVMPFLILGDLMFEKDPLTTMKKAFRKAHYLVEALSDSHDSAIDSTLSGTTGTCILYRDNKLFIAHVGDSRSVLAVKTNNHIEAVDLTVDHKPTIELERKRIESLGGEVRQLEGDIPHRVFVRRRLYPGLAMSRAIGDSIGASVGVTSDPDVKVVELNPCGVDQFVIIATDGVWEFISSQEAVDFVNRKGRSGVQKAADFVAYESWRRWVEEEENVVDDVTCIVFWIDQTTSQQSSSSSAT